MRLVVLSLTAAAAVTLAAGLPLELKPASPERSAAEPAADAPLTSPPHNITTARVTSPRPMCSNPSLISGRRRRSVISSSSRSWPSR